MKINVNLNDVQEGGTFVLVPEWVYNVEIVVATDGYSKKGDPMIGIEMIIIDGEFSGSKAWDNILIPAEGSTSWKIMGRTKHFLHCIGEPYEGKIEVDTKNWVYKRCKITIKHEQPNQHHNYIKAIVSGYDFPDENIKKETETIPF